MGIFARKYKTGYVSDATRMIREMLVERPRIVEEQRRGRALWWDRKLDPAEQRRLQESAVPQKGYVYQTED